ncbi:hypothetical protein HK101_000899 [Irineochytrium annulatum]|nr:hypothetical protein HK101_000899 [Irineochytrium annulatum]
MRSYRVAPSSGASSLYKVDEPPTRLVDLEDFSRRDIGSNMVSGKATVEEVKEHFAKAWERTMQHLNNPNVPATAKPQVYKPEGKDGKGGAPGKQADGKAGKQPSNNLSRP